MSVARTVVVVESQLLYCNQAPLTLFFDYMISEREVLTHHVVTRIWDTRLYALVPVIGFEDVAS
ncbi:MAG: hypothetical protein OXC18_16230 [Desulfurellaceae bacterium]|nr:hypothetical protein [Desulfurellaceae bacterium]